jgi:hypothetical protein
MQVGNPSTWEPEVGLRVQGRVGIHIKKENGLVIPRRRRHIFVL